MFIGIIRVHQNYVKIIFCQNDSKYHYLNSRTLTIQIIDRHFRQFAVDKYNNNIAQLLVMQSLI